MRRHYDVRLRHVMLTYGEMPRNERYASLKRHMLVVVIIFPSFDAHAHASAHPRHICSAPSDDTVPPCRASSKHARFASSDAAQAAARAMR